jgi:subtilisin family serine protease
MWTRSLSAPKWAIFLILISSISVSAQIAADRYTLILEDQPVAERFVGRESVRSALALEYGQQIERKQLDLRRELETRQIRITGATSTLLNAIFVTASADRVEELKSLPGVKAVIPQRQFKPKMNRASALVDAPAAWNAAGGIQNAGAGVKIGIIDTGIDQTHAAFQDSSLTKPAGFPKCNVPSDCTNFTNNKVIVARSYVPMLIGSSPANSCPDDISARYRSGHGTAVAAIAAGNSNTGTVTFNGIAPKAYLGSYKIYGSDEVGCLSFTEDTVHVALQDAFKDGMDIVNYSSGGAAYTGPLDTGAACGLSAGTPCDLLATDFENAAKAGLTIVAAAGNDGYFAYNYPAFNSIETPGDAPDVISVGASTNGHYFVETVSVPGAPSNLQNIQGNTGDSPTLDPGALTLQLFDATQLGDSTGLQRYSQCCSLRSFHRHGLDRARHMQLFHKSDQRHERRRAGRDSIHGGLERLDISQQPLHADSDGDGFQRRRCQPQGLGGCASLCSRDDRSPGFRE